MVYILLSKQSDKPIEVIKVYDSELKANADMNMLLLVAKDTKFRILQSEYEKTAKVRAKPKQAEEYSEDFNSVWAKYPKKVSKGEAWEAWQKVKPPVYEVLKTLNWQITSQQWTQEGGKWVPNLATYLNKRKWQDEQADTVIINGKPWFIAGASAIEAKAAEMGLEITREELPFQFYDRVRKEAGITREMVDRANNEHRTH